MKESYWSKRDMELITSDGNVRHYINDDRIETFNMGDCADLAFPKGYGHCNRVYRGYSPALTCSSIMRPCVKVKARK